MYLYVPGTIMVTVLADHEALQQKEHVILEPLIAIRLPFIIRVETRQASFLLCVIVKFLPFTNRVSCGLSVATTLNGANSAEFQKRQPPLIVQV